MTAAKRKWSQEVTGHSDALDLEADVFTLDDPLAMGDLREVGGVGQPLEGEGALADQLR